MVEFRVPGLLGCDGAALCNPWLTPSELLRTGDLIFHGQQDRWVCSRTVRRSNLQLPPEARRVLTDDNHITLQIRLDVVGPQALAWFEEHLLARADSLGP